MSVNENEFIVSARKYRPATFKSVVGQQHITSTLQNAIASKQLAQAFLFCGPRGVGKTTCARILAKTINCLNVTDEIEACNECDSCKSFNDGSSVNIFELDAASNNSVEDIRELVNQVNIPPMNGKYKVYIIDEVHMLSSAAFNAFLKTLEEPPAYAKFILATTEKHKILPTILSRCQIFDFHRINNIDISNHLEYIAKQENVQYEKAALDIIATKADGALRDALSTFDTMVAFTNGNLAYSEVISSLNILDYEYFFQFIDFFLAADLTNSLLKFDEVLKKGFEGDIFVNGLASHLRNLLVCQNPQTIQLLDVPASVQEKYLLQSKNCPTIFILRCLDFANKTAQEYKTSSNKRLCVELLLMKMCNVMAKLSAGAEKKNSNSDEIIIQQPIQTQENTQEIQITTPPTPKIDLLNRNKTSAFSIKSTNVTEPKTEEQAKLVPFNINDVVSVIKDYSNKIKDFESNLYFALSSVEIKSNTDYVVQIWAKSSFDFEEITKHKTDIAQKLRKELLYENLKIDIMMEKQEHNAKAYTAMDKFFELQKQNNLLQDLVKEFAASIEL